MIPEETHIVEASKLFKEILVSGAAGTYYFIYGELYAPKGENTHGLIVWHGQKHTVATFGPGIVDDPTCFAINMVDRAISSSQRKANWAWILNNSEQVRETLGRVHTVLSGDIADNGLDTKYTYCLKMMNQIRCKLPFPDCHMLSDWEGKGE